MKTCSWSGGSWSQDGAATSRAGMWQGQPLPKIYQHVISSAVIKALGSRKAKGTGEHRVGGGKNISQTLSFSNKRR